MPSASRSCAFRSLLLGDALAQPGALRGAPSTDGGAGAKFVHVVEHLRDRLDPPGGIGVLSLELARV